MKLRWLFIMAWRDSRRNRSRLLLFMASITCGIAALVAIYSFGYDLRRNVDDQAATLIGADLMVSSNRPIDGPAALLLDSLGGERSTEERFGSMVLFPRTGGTRLAEIRALEGAFPYYGRIETTPSGADQVFRNSGAALVDKALLLQFDAKVGDSIKVGLVTFLIAGELDQAPNQTGVSSTVAPIVYIPLSYMAATGLSQRGSRITYTEFFHFNRGTDANKLARRIEPRLEKMDMSYDTVETRKEKTGRFFGDLTNFLSLVGFVALLLGCIGVASAIHIYIKEKTATIAVLRCLGVTAARAFAIYLIQVAAIGLIGAVVGSLLGSGIQQLLPLVFKDFLPLSIHTEVSGKAIGQGIALGVVIAVIFGLSPLLSIRRISSLLVLRSSFEQGTGAPDPLRLLVYALMLLFVGGFTYLQLGSWESTIFFTISIVGAFLVLAGVATALMALVRAIVRRSWSFLIRQGFANLYRPNNQTVILVVAIGLSTALIAILVFIQQTVLTQLTVSGGKSQSNMILFDIQSAQQQAVDSLTRDAGLPIMEDVPIVTARIVSINGKTRGQSEEDSTRGKRRRMFDEELRVTYRQDIAATDRVTQGKWTGVAEPGKVVPVSLEEDYGRHIGVKIGDSLVFNVQGTDIPTDVGSFRKITWNRMQTNFRVVFPSGVLEAAPQFHVLLTRTPSTEVSVKYQQAVVRRFPNVSIIDLALILSVLDDILDKISFVIHFMAAFSIVTGLIVLIASVRNSKYQRLQESVLLRTLGAVRRQVLVISALEYFFLGVLSALTGILIALAGSWLLAKFMFKISYSISAITAVFLFLAVSFLTMIIGLLNSRGILNRSTLEILRTDV